MVYVISALEINKRDCLDFADLLLSLPSISEGALCGQYFIWPITSPINQTVFFLTADSAEFATVLAGCESRSKGFY
jgi:hypothetical protein